MQIQAAIPCARCEHSITPAEAAAPATEPRYDHELGRLVCRPCSVETLHETREQVARLLAAHRAKLATLTDVSVVVEQWTSKTWRIANAPEARPSWARSRGADLVGRTKSLDRIIDWYVGRGARVEVRDPQAATPALPGTEDTMSTKTKKAPKTTKTAAVKTATPKAKAEKPATVAMPKAGLPPVGSVLEHTFHGTGVITATVAKDGIEYGGKTYKSMTAAAMAALRETKLTTKVNGRRFWTPHKAAAVAA